YIDVENMGSHESDDIDDRGVYKEIYERFGVSVVRPKYKPEGMKLKRYSFDDTQRKAYLFYEYNREVIRYSIYMNDTGYCSRQKDLDFLMEEYEVESNKDIINMEENKVEDSESKRYNAKFE